MNHPRLRFVYSCHAKREPFQGRIKFLRGSHTEEDNFPNIRFYLNSSQSFTLVLAPSMEGYQTGP